MADAGHNSDRWVLRVVRERRRISQDPVTGEPVSYFKRDIKDVIDDLADSGFIKIAERQIKRRRVYKSIITCTAVLKDKQLIAGEHIHCSGIRRVGLR